ncbi:hypothetical protein G9A89_013862 [Geosiphon pyriformis]|nr:hypothetical protein G9A89_013862 [Geosiphon pyriformis]
MGDSLDDDFPHLFYEENIITDNDLSALIIDSEEYKVRSTTLLENDSKETFKTTPKDGTLDNVPRKEIIQSEDYRLFSVSKKNAKKANKLQERISKPAKRKRPQADTREDLDKKIKRSDSFVDPTLGKQLQGTPDNIYTVHLKGSEQDKQNDLISSNYDNQSKQKKKPQQKFLKNEKKATQNLWDPPIDFTTNGQMDYFLRKQKSVLDHLSSIEFTERQLTENSFIDTSLFSKERTLESMAAFIDLNITSHHNISRPPLLEQKGAPILLILTASAKRAVNIIRSLKAEKSIALKNGVIGKLFAKHLKLSEQEEFLKKNSFDIAVGTPNRVFKLLTDFDSLRLFRLKYILIDASWKDEKKRTIFDIPECLNDLIQLMGADKVLDMVKAVGDENPKTLIMFY